MFYINLFPLILVILVITISAEECEYDENGSCIEECPQGMVKYNPPCDETTMSQKTCRTPIARSIGALCDYSRCDCPDPKVWDEAAKICVMIDDCSDQSGVTGVSFKK